MNENKKVGLSTWEWILSITGIIVLILLMAMPPVFRIIFEESEIVNLPEEENKDEDKNKDNDKTVVDENKYLKVTCSKQDYSSNDYVETKGIILSHQENKLRIVTEISTRIYKLDSKDNENLFAKEKLACTSIPESYKQVKGYNYTCTGSDDSVQITETFTLDKFKESNVVDNDGNQKEIKTIYSYDQDLETIKISLTSDGYVCQ